MSYGGIYLIFIINALKIIFMLGFLVFIHELGHFLVARACKVRVNEFAIGFGHTIWKKQIKETKYAIRAIPLGGFVSMEGEAEPSDKEGSFSSTSIIKRIAIVAAGGIVNIIFALVVIFILVWVTYGTFLGALDFLGYFIVSIFESLKLIFTGNINAEQLMRACWNIWSCITNQ